MPRTGGYHPPGAEGSRDGVAHPLDGDMMIARGDQRADAGFAQHLERRACFAGRSTPLCAANAADDLIWKWTLVRHPRAGDREELSQVGRLGPQSVSQELVAQAPKTRHVRIIGWQE